MLSSNHEAQFISWRIYVPLSSGKAVNFSYVQTNNQQRWTMQTICWWFRLPCRSGGTRCGVHHPMEHILGFTRSKTPGAGFVLTIVGSLVCGADKRENLGLGLWLRSINRELQQPSETQRWRQVRAYRGGVAGEGWVGGASSYCLEVGCIGEAVWPGPGGSTWGCGFIIFGGRPNKRGRHKTKIKNIVNSN